MRLTFRTLIALFYIYSLGATPSFGQISKRPSSEPDFRWALKTNILGGITGEFLNLAFEYPTSLRWGWEGRMTYLPPAPWWDLSPYEGMGLRTHGFRIELNRQFYFGKGSSIAFGIMSKFYSADSYYTPDRKSWQSTSTPCQIQDRRQLSIIPKLQFRVGNPSSQKWLRQFYIGFGYGRKVIYGRSHATGTVIDYCQATSVNGEKFKVWRPAALLQLGFFLGLRKH